MGYVLPETSRPEAAHYGELVKKHNTEKYTNKLNDIINHSECILSRLNKALSGCLRLKVFYLVAKSSLIMSNVAKQQGEAVIIFRPPWSASELYTLHS